MSSSSESWEDESSEELMSSEVSSEQSEMSSGESEVSDISSELSELSSSSSEAEVELQVNDTEGGNDDIVRLKSLIPAKRFFTPCRVGLRIRRPHTPVMVSLSNPDGRLRFHLHEADPPSTSLTIELAANGDWKSFYISGEQKSIALGDAKIRLKRGNRILATAAVTVFYFEPSDITVGRGSAYRYDSGIRVYAPINLRNAVNYSASAVIKPEGVNCGVPNQTKDLYIGIVQNVSNLTFTERYSEPVPIWNDSAVSGTTVTLPAVIERVTKLDGVYLDGNAETGPIYQVDPVTDAHAFERPVGCAAGKAASSRDTPKITGVGRTERFPMNVGTQNLGEAFYAFSGVSIKASFTTWVVTFENILGTKLAIYPLRQTEWSLDVDSARTSAQFATVPSGDHAVSAAPKLDGEYANVAVNAAPEVVGPSGTATVTLTKP